MQSLFEDEKTIEMATQLPRLFLSLARALPLSLGCLTFCFVHLRMKIPILPKIKSHSISAEKKNRTKFSHTHSHTLTYYRTLFQNALIKMLTALLSANARTRPNTVIIDSIKSSFFLFHSLARSRTRSTSWIQ